MTNHEQIPLKQLRTELGEAVTRVAYSGKRILITKFGKPTAALISAEDLTKLEQMEGQSE